MGILPWRHIVIFSMVDQGLTTGYAGRGTALFSRAHCVAPHVAHPRTI